MIKILKIILIYFVTVSCLSKGGTMTKEQITADIKEGYVLLSFVKAGSTASIRYAYSELKNNDVLKNKLTIESLNDLKEILKDVKWRRHKQKKITGIERGIELCNTGGCYCLILTQNQIIDVTRNYEANLTSTEYHLLSKLFNAKSQ